MIQIKEAQGKIPPGEFGIPIVRQNIHFLTNPATYGDMLEEKYGDICKTHLLGSPTIFVQGQDFLDHILNNEGKLFESTFPPTFEKLLGNSISTQLGEKHRKSRKIISDIFRYKNISHFSENTRKKAISQLNDWERKTNYNLYEDIRSFCFDIACEYLLEKKDLSKEKIFKAYCDFEKGLFSIPINIPFLKFNRAINARSYISHYIDSIIPDLQTNDSAISKLLETDLDKEEIKDQILVLLFAGHGTLASAIWSVIYQLAKNSEVKANCFKFIKNESINPGICEKYITSIALECLRISSPVVGLFRKVIKTNTFNGYIFPQHWTVAVQIRETHLSSKVYPNPNTFDPTRYFSSSTKNKMYAFGGGPRECIGKLLALEEIKIFIKELVKNYEWHFEDINKIQIDRLPVVSPKENYKISFSRICKDE